MREIRVKYEGDIMRREDGVEEKLRRRSGKDDVKMKRR